MNFNEFAASGIVAGIIMLIIVVTGTLGFIYISGAFDDQYNTVISDPNATITGMYLNNSTPYQGVKTITTGITDNIPFAILIAFLLAVILIVMLVWAILKRGE